MHTSFFGLVQLGYREVLKKFNESQERKGLFPGDGANLGDEEVDMSEDRPAAPATPQMKAPSTPKPKPRTVSRAPTRVRALSQHGSGIIEATPMKDNPFTTVPANFNPQVSPQRKGKKRERELKTEVEVTPKSETVVAAAAVKEDEVEALDLDLALDPGLEGGSPPKKKSKS